MASRVPKFHSVSISANVTTAPAQRPIAACRSPESKQPTTITQNATQGPLLLLDTVHSTNDNGLMNEVNEVI